MTIRVADQEIPWRPGLTVAELLRELEDPGSWSVVRMNGRYVTRPHFEETPIPDGAEIYLIPMIAGG